MRSINFVMKCIIQISFQILMQKVLILDVLQFDMTDEDRHREQVLRSKVWAATATNDNRKCSLLRNTFSIAQGQSNCPRSFLRRCPLVHISLTPNTKIKLEWLDPSCSILGRSKVQVSAKRWVSWILVFCFPVLPGKSLELYPNLGYYRFSHLASNSLCTSDPAIQSLIYLINHK